MGEDNIKGYITQWVIDGKIYDLKDAKLTSELHDDYATKEEVSEAIENLEIPDGVTPQFIDNKNEATGDDVYFVYDESEDVQFDFATKQDITDAIENIEIPEVDLSNYATKQEIPSVDGLATEQFVENAIANIEIPDSTNHEFITDKTQATGDDVYFVYDEVEDIQANFATKQDITDAIDAIEIPSIDGLATEQYVGQQVEGLASTQYVDDAIANIDIPEVNLTNYALKSEVHSYWINLNPDSNILYFHDGKKNINLSSLGSNAQLDITASGKFDGGANLQHTVQQGDGGITGESLDLKTLTGDVSLANLKQYIRIRFQVKIGSIGVCECWMYNERPNLITRDELDNITPPDVDLSGYYTKTEIDDIVGDIYTRLSQINGVE